MSFIFYHQLCMKEKTRTGIIFSYIFPYLHSRRGVFSQKMEGTEATLYRKQEFKVERPFIDWEN
jgi:hypothetical protein